jgi:hypothetical protein
MKNLTKMCLILSCVFLVSCNQEGGDSSPAAVPEHPTSDLSGTVSSVINFLNPISSAYAAASEICVSDKKSNRKVEIYLVDEKGNETFVCHTSLNKNGTFTKKIKRDLIPDGSEIIVKAFYNGTIRESYVNSSATTDVNVDPASTLAVPAIKHQRKQGRKIDAKKIRIQISKFVDNKIGAKLAEMKAPKIAALKFMMENSEETLEMTLFNPGKDIALDKSFQKFMENVHKTNKRIGMNDDITRGLEFVYSEENAKKLDLKINGKITEIVDEVKKKR